MHPPTDPGLSLVLEAAGSHAELARRISAVPGQRSLTRAAVSQWSRVPHDRVLAAEAVTSVPRVQIRPDLYGPTPSATAA